MLNIVSTEKYRQDTKKSHITKKTTNEKNRLELTPETTVRTAKASSSALGPRQLHFGEDGKSVLHLNCNYVPGRYVLVKK